MRHISLSRRFPLPGQFLGILILIILIGSCTNSNPQLIIGLVADPQYQDKNTSGKRQYRESIWKLEQAVDTFNTHEVDFIQNLGDIIDRKWVSFDALLPVYEKVDQGTDVFHLLGNHDFAIDSIKMPGLIEKLGMPDHYYSYVRKNWRFIVLNSMDYSYLGNPLYNRDIDVVDSYYNNTIGRINHFDWNGAIGEEQQEWLRSELKEAEQKKQKVIVFSHMPLLPEEVEERLLNSEEIVEILESSPAVVAHINGHRHKGAYALQNGIHYISIFGMVDTDISSFAILEIYKDGVELNGYGHQESLRLTPGPSPALRYAP